MVATALLVIVLVTWASSIGPGDVLRGEGLELAGTPTEAVSTPADAGGEPGTTEGSEPEDIEVHAWVRVLLFVLNIAFAVLVAALLVRYVVAPLVRRARARRLRGPREEVDFVALEPPQVVARALLGDAAEQRRVLVEGGSPRNAVVECWHRFESAAADAGFERRPWETSSEYTMRVLDVVDAYQPAVTALGDLYREARFSEHELSEDDRRIGAGRARRDPPHDRHPGMNRLRRSRWWRRAAGGVVIFAALEAVLLLTETDPDPLRLALLVATCVGVAGLTVDALSDATVSWDVTIEQPSVRTSGDSRLSLYVNLLDAHRAAKTHDTALRDRIGMLADQVLRQRYGVARDDPRAVELLGPELAAVLTGPARRLAPAEIDRYLTRIEEL